MRSTASRDEQEGMRGEPAAVHPRADVDRRRSLLPALLPLWLLGTCGLAVAVAALPATAVPDRPALLVSSGGQAVVALLAAVAVLVRRTVDPASRRSWSCAGAAAVCWGLAQALLTLDRAAGDGVRGWPVDLLFCVAAVSAVAAALTAPAVPRHLTGVLRSWLDGGVIVSSVLLLTWLRVGPALPGAVDTLQGALSLAYPVIDCLVAALLVDSVVRAPREQAASLAWVTGGLVVLAATNLEAFVAALHADAASSVAGVDATPLAAGYVVGFALVGTGGLLRRRSGTGPGPDDAGADLIGRTQQVLPFAVLPAVLLLLLLRPAALQRPGAVLLAVLAVLVLARQWSALSENAELAAQLIARARRYEALVHGATDVTLVLDAASVVTYASPSVARVLGREPATLLGVALQDLLEPDSGPLDDLTTTPALLLQMRSARDGRLPVLLEARVSDLRHDPQVRGLVLNGHDVTERWGAELAREHSERRFTRIVETAHEGIWVNDADGLTRFVNAEACRMLGLDAADLLGRPPLDVLGCLLDSDRARTDLAERLQHGADGGSTRYTFSLRRPDGTRVHVQVAASPLRDAAGRADGSLTMLSDVTERVELEERLSHDARTDALTGLPNRSALLNRTAVALTAPLGAPALVYCDLDGFKTVNDTGGHAAGDSVLQQVALRLRTAIGPDALLARLGGDEFAVLLEGAPSAQDADAVVQGLLSAMAEPVRVDGRVHHVGVSVGVATALPGDDAGALLRNADMAMYRAKQDGRGRARAYEPSMHVAARTRRDLEDGLWEAVEADQLTLHYQPVVELATGRCVGAEALLRWEHPELGSVPPDVFIPVAEDTGAIVAIGRWVLQTGCAEAAAWRRDGLDLRLSVNIAPRQLLDAGLVADVAEAVRASGLTPSDLLLEITERSLLAGEQTARTLRELRATGSLLALDDFGTGWSSISHLRDHAVDVLKLDRSYVGDMLLTARTGRLVHAVLDLSRHLGTSSTAEGVETQGQADALRDQGCVYAQGYLFSRPLPAAAFRSWLRDRGDVPGLPAPRRATAPLLH